MRENRKRLAALHFGAKLVRKKTSYMETPDEPEKEEKAIV